MKVPHLSVRLYLRRDEFNVIKPACAIDVSSVELCPGEEVIHFEFDAADMTAQSRHFALDQFRFLFPLIEAGGHPMPLEESEDVGVFIARIPRDKNFLPADLSC